MEMILTSLCLAIFIALLLLKSLLNRKSATNFNLPPSPWRLPVIGNLHQLSIHPHRSLRSLSRRYGPIMLLHFGRTPVIIVSSSDVAHDVLKTHDLKCANRPKTKVVDKILSGGRDVAFAPYGEYWRQIKAICIQNLLSNKMVRSYEKIREEEIKVLTKKLEIATSSSSPVNLSKLLMTMTNDIICRIALGRKYSNEKDGIDVENIVNTFAALLGEFPFGEYIPSLSWIDKIRGLDHEMEKVDKRFNDFLEKVVQEHADSEYNERSDFVDMLISIQRDETSQFKLDKNVLKLIIWDMFLAGTATTFSFLEWTMTELIRHPEIMKKLQDEIRSNSRQKNDMFVTEKQAEKFNYLQAVIKEALRLRSPAPLLLPRVVTEDIKLKGYNIAAGTQIIINVWAIQRDITTCGIDAEEFKPERHFGSVLDFQGQHFEYIPFGSGKRICPGIGFTSALIGVTLANIVKRFNWRMEIVSSQDSHFDVAETTGLVIFRKSPLIVCPSLA